jgi:hypothetical protein
MRRETRQGRGVEWLPSPEFNLLNPQIRAGFPRLSTDAQNRGQFLAPLRRDGVAPYLPGKSIRQPDIEYSTSHRINIRMGLWRSPNRSYNLQNRQECN